MTTTGRTAASWREMIPQEDLALYRAAGYGGRTALGEALAVLVIDVTYGFAGPERAPVEKSVQTHPNSCGVAAWDAVDALVPLLAAARTADVPVFYTVDVAASQDAAGNVWAHKQTRLEGRPSGENDIIAEVAPRAGEAEVVKTRPTAFFGTDLADRLRALGITGLLVAGGTTSGCVRASVVDAFSHGFAVAVVEDCVFDRAYLTHSLNLFDLDQKYANVISRDDAIVLVQNSPIHRARPGHGDTSHGGTA
jgi:maleamate amidohydrolase